ncbi:hypothetical protein V4C53_02120 [Paraburkholderia azotifigens]|uniref:hypothetical protein n=1 Tax=Paraburkholderia azotifigens TaxID=2057004 RepID=UPI00317627BB
MKHSQQLELLCAAAVTLIERQDGGSEAARVLLPHWIVFVQFLLQNAMAPTSIHDIPEQALREFSRHCDTDGGLPFHDATLALGAVRLILRWAGFDTRFLANLSAPRTRRQVVYNGKVRRNQRARPPAGPALQQTDAGHAEPAMTAARKGSSRKTKASGD